MCRHQLSLQKHTEPTREQPGSREHASRVTVARVGRVFSRLGDDLHESGLQRGATHQEAINVGLGDELLEAPRSFKMRLGRLGMARTYVGGKRKIKSNRLNEHQRSTLVFNKSSIVILLFCRFYFYLCKIRSCGFSLNWVEFQVLTIDQGRPPPQVEGESL